MKNILFDKKPWLESNEIPNQMKESFIKLDLFEQKQHFNNELNFGTGGMRGIIGIGPSCINSIMIIRATKGFATFILSKYDSPTIIIGYDNRHYSKEFAYNVACSLSALNIKVLLFDNLIATPLVSYAIREYHAHGGIIITASHNPKEYNGYKIYDESGCQILPKDIEIIKSNIKKMVDPFNNISSTDNITYLDDSIINSYLVQISSLHTFKDNQISFAYSAQHGTGLIPIEKLIKYYNINNGYILENQSFNNPDFINTKCANPESIDAYTMLIEYGKSNNTQLLFTTDPDCDRLGVAYYKDEEYHLLTGNQLGILIFDYLIRIGYDIEDKYIVSTIVSTPLAKVIAKKHGIKFHEVLTGFKYIGDIINRYNEEDFLFGFEESYGYLVLGITRDKDAIQIFLIVLAMCNYYKNINKNIYDVLEDVYQEYGYYLESLTTLSLNNNDIDIVYNALKDYVYNNIKEIIDYELGLSYTCNNTITTKVDLDQSQVYKIIFSDNSFICFRPSGTEALIKVYISVNAKSKEQAEVKLAEYQSIVNNIIKGVRHE